MPASGKILIADDEVDFTAVTADLLREEGYECDCAADAQFAGELLKKNQYDLLVSDIKMPGNDGLEFIEELPALAPGLPVILVTGYPALDTAIKATRLSVVGYMQKPTPIDDFIKLVRESVVRAQTFRMLDVTRDRLQSMQSALGSVTSLKTYAPGKTSFVDVDMFLHHTMQNMLASMIDLKDLMQALSQNKSKQNACQLLNCPRHAELLDMIRDAIMVLEKTKHSFRSKELAALRFRLEKAFKPNAA